MPTRRPSLIRCRCPVADPPVGVTVPHLGIDGGGGRFVPGKAGGRAGGVHSCWRGEPRPAPQSGRRFIVGACPGCGKQRPARPDQQAAEVGRPGDLDTWWQQQRRPAAGGGVEDQLAEIREAEQPAGVPPSTTAPATSTPTSPTARGSCPARARRVAGTATAAGQPAAARPASGGSACQRSRRWPPRPPGCRRDAAADQWQNWPVQSRQSSNWAMASRRHSTASPGSRLAA